MEIDPWISKDNLREHLLNLKEDRQLDALIEEYVRSVLEHKIIRSPSKGSREYGKDIVAVENRKTGDYCSYVVKRGKLGQNLRGPFGILTQMKEAMLIPLPEPEYQNSQRTVRVVHNGKAGSRDAINKFVQSKIQIEDEVGRYLLLRPVERWDIEDITDRLFSHGERLRKSELYRKVEEGQSAILNAALELFEDLDPLVQTSESTYNKTAQPLFKFWEKVQTIKQKYAFPLTKTKDKRKKK